MNIDTNIYFETTKKGFPWTGEDSIKNLPTYYDAKIEMSNRTCIGHCMSKGYGHGTCISMAK